MSRLYSRITGGMNFFIICFIDADIRFYRLLIEFPYITAIFGLEILFAG